MDKNGKLSDYESVHESGDGEYDSDRSISYGFSSESEIDFDNLSHDKQLIQLHKHQVLENLPKLHGPKLLSQRMDTWIFSLIV